MPGDWSGTISDDTQLTLATCESVIAAGGVRPEEVANAFISWYRAGRITGIGASTLKALRELDGGMHWALAGAKGEMSAGNGAAMRVAPLAFLLDPAVPSARSPGRFSARTLARPRSTQATCEESAASRKSGRSRPILQNLRRDAPAR